MLTCITRSKRAGDDSPPQPDEGDSKNHSVKSLTSQLKDMALKASGAYKNCAPTCTAAPGQDRLRNPAGPDPESNRFKRTHSSNSSSTPRVWGKEMEARLKGISSGEATPKSSSGRERLQPIVFVEEKEPKEWVAQVEPGVLITFLSLPRGGNDLKRIRFSRDKFSKWQAQKWWAENFEKIMELYNVQRLNRQACPLPIPPVSEHENTKPENSEDRPTTPPLNRETFPHSMQHPMGMSYSSSDSLDYQPTQARNYYNSSGINSTPKLSSISGTKTETSSMDTSIRSSSSREADRLEDMSLSNASDLENEWVEEDEPGVYITIRALPGGKRELRRVRFSRDRFGEMHARVWWEENRARIHEQYL